MIQLGRHSVAIYRAASLDALARLLADPTATAAPGAGRFTVAIVASDAEDLRSKRQRARTAVAAGQRISDDTGIYFEPQPFGPGAVAFVFPGQGSQYAGMLGGLRAAPAFAQASDHLDRLGRPVFGRSLSEWVFDGAGDEARLADTRAAQAALGFAAASLARLLDSVGIRAAFAAGHSYGEIVALWYAGALTDTGLLRVTERRGSLMAAANQIAPGGMAAVGASEREVADLIAGTGLEVANLNTARQTVVSGDTGALDAFLAACGGRGVRAVRLKTACAFHSSRMAPALGDWSSFLAARVAAGELSAPRSATVIANATAAPHPGQPGEVAELLARQLVGRVRWIESCDRLYAEGARIFIEVGPGEVLTRAIGQNLGDRPHLALRGDPRDVEPTLHLARLLARLAAHGATLPAAEPQPERTRMTLHDSVVREFVVNNTRLVERFLELGEKVLDAANTDVPGESKDALLMRFLDVSARLTSEFLSVQARGFDAAAGTGAPAALRSTPVTRQLPATATASQDNAPVAAPPRPSVTVTGTSSAVAPAAPVAAAPVAAAPVAAAPESADLETWLRAEISKVTGFPVSSIERDAPFEELGIDSLAFTELFSRLATKVPSARDRVQALFEAKSIAAVVAVLAPEPTAAAPSAPVAEVAPAAPQVAAATAAPAVPIAPANPGASLSPGLTALRQRILAAVKQLARRPTIEIGEDTPFDELGLNAFDREALWEGTALAVPTFALAGEALMPARSVAEALALLARFEPHADRQPARDTAPPADALARYERIEIARAVPAGSAALPARVVICGPPGATLDRFRTAYGAAGIEVSTVQLTADGWIADGEAFALEDLERLSVALAHRRGSAAERSPIVFLTAPGTAMVDAPDEARWTGDVDRNAVGLFGVAKALAASPGALAATGHVGVVLTGNASAADVAARGVARALGHEWRSAGIAVTSLALADAAAVDPVLALQIMLGHPGAHDLTLRGRELFEAQIERRDRALDAAAEPPIARGGVVLLFGGGVGIAAEIGVDLAARYHATVVALGRTPWSGADPYPQAASDAELAEAVHAELAAAGKKPQAARLQQALSRARRQRELSRTAARIRAAGGRFEYRCADVTSEPDVAREVAWIRDQLGPVELVIHAAGVVEDRLLGGKSIESFRRVLHTKTRSAFHLRRAIHAMAPRRVALFSSLVAHTGNAGQADYCAANEVLGAVAAEWSRDGAHVVSFLWSVWTETGLAGHGVQMLMKQHQLAGITSRDGARYFHAEMARGAGPSWVLVTSPKTIDVVQRGPLSASSDVAQDVRRSA